VEYSNTSSNVRNLIKQIVHNSSINAKVIIVLSEADAGLAFDGDHRAQFVWVDEMTDEEAKIYARKMYPDVSDAESFIVLSRLGSFLWILNSLCYH
jgi:hypothetical protein